MAGEKRIGWLDIAKALVIVLVVFGHTMRNGAMQRMVYGFHVPAFFFLSGMTVKTDQLRRRIMTDVKRILVPYYCFGVLSILIYAVLGSLAASKFAMQINTSVPRNLLGLLYASPYKGALQFNAPLWFLPCLFTVKLIYFVLQKLTSGNRERALLLSCLLAALGFVCSGWYLSVLPFALSIAMKMVPFFAAGAVFSGAAWKQPQRGTALIAGLILVAAACIVGYWFPKVNYTSETFPNIPVFCVTALCGCFGTVFLAMAIHRSRLLEYIGRNTLGILVMHKFPVLFFQIIGPFETLLERHDTLAGNGCGLFISVVAIFLCLIAAEIIKRLFPFMLGFPGIVRKPDGKGNQKT